jgi:hypothetical protein
MNQAAALVFNQTTDGLMNVLEVMNQVAGI